MEDLIKLLKGKIPELPAAHSALLSDDILAGLYSIYPFNEYEYIISHLIADGVLDIEGYYDIRNSYLNRNKYLYVYEITAPRTFGETWAQRHLNEVVPELRRPTKALDPGYVGQYDFWYDNIRIEVKASRAVRRKGGGQSDFKSAVHRKRAAVRYEFSADQTALLPCPRFYRRMERQYCILGYVEHGSGVKQILFKGAAQR